MSGVEEFSQMILRQLLADFLDQNLGSEALSRNYRGVPIAALKHESCGGNAAAAVDFDLALKDLEDGHLVATGPMVPYKNSPDSAVVVVGLFSKREYACLTEKGYKAAQRGQAERASRSGTPRVHISGGNFHHSPIGIGSRINQSVRVSNQNVTVFVNLREAVEGSDIDPADRARLLAGIEAMEKAQSSPGFMDKYKEFIAIAANHIAIIGPFLPALSALLSGN
jgi:hypothetical protein